MFARTGGARHAHQPADQHQYRSALNERHHQASDPATRPRMSESTPAMSFRRPTCLYW